MANITIKDLPDKVHKELKNAARSQGRSLNGYIVSILEMSVDERCRRQMMREGRAEFRAFLASLPAFTDSTEMIREDRDRGHR
jgi:plasmid stability protein